MSGETDITIHEGMMVYGSDGRPIGAVEEVREGGICVNGRMVLLPALWRVTEDGIYLRDSGERLRPQSGPRQWQPPRA